MSKTSKPLYQIINNVRFPTLFERENIEFALNYKPLNTDKFLVTYPKCGTHWTNKIIFLILNDGIPQETDEENMKKCLIERRGSASIQNKVIITHLPFELMPYNKFTKYLCVFRNPKDTCVSYYYHLKAFQFEGEFHEFFNLFINGELGYTDYFNHTLTLWSHRFDDNFTFLFYEHMKNNTRDAVLKIGEFLGHEYMVKLKDNNDFILNEVIKHSSIESMKSAHKSSAHGIRKGIVGDWKNHFNKAESDLIDDKVIELFTGTGLEELWAEDMKW